MSLFQKKIIDAPYKWSHRDNNSFYIVAQDGDNVYAPFTGKIKNNVLTVDDMTVTFYNVNIKDGFYKVGDILGKAMGCIGISVQENNEYKDAFAYIVMIDNYEHKLIKEETVEEKPVSKKVSKKK